MKVKTLARQKNRALKEIILLRVLLCVFVIICLSQGQITYYLLKNEKIHLIPEGFKEGFWISGKYADANYLVQMAEFWGGLILTANVSNHDFRMQHLLDHVDPNFHASMKSMLLEQKEKLKGGISTSFSANKFIADENKLLVEISGILHLFEGGRPLESVKAKFKMGFSMKSGKIFVRSFEEVKGA